MIGCHLVHHWAKMQQRVSLSSGESELYASNRGYREVASVVNVGRELRGDDWGHVEHVVDSSACRSIILRKGAGDMKHLEARDLWCRDFVRRNRVKVTRVDRQFNASDALASPCSPSDLSKHLTRLGVRRTESCIGSGSVPNVCSVRQCVRD